MSVYERERKRGKDEKVVSGIREGVCKREGKKQREWGEGGEGRSDRRSVYKRLK